MFTSVFQITFIITKISVIFNYSTSRKVMAGLRSKNKQHHLHLLFSRRMAPYTHLKLEQHNAVINTRLNRVPMREISKNIQIPKKTIR